MFVIFRYLSPFYFLLIEFHCTFSIFYKILQYFVYYYYILNVKVLGIGLELLRANGGRLEINQLLFADDSTSD